MDTNTTKTNKKPEVVKTELELTSSVPQPTITLTKEQQKIISYAQTNPQKFADELTERIIQKSGLDPQNPLEIESARTVAQTFTLKVLEIDPNKEIVIDSSAFEVLAMFANPENPVFASVIPSPETRERIAETVQNLSFALEKDTTLATNWINQATGADWSAFFIPPQIRELKEIPKEEFAKTTGVSVNLERFLQQITTTQTIETQIRRAVIDDDSYRNLTKIERIKLDKAIKKASNKISSKLSAFSFLTKRKTAPFLENKIEKKGAGWLGVYFSALGITPKPNSQSFTNSFNFGHFSSPNILNSPIFNFALDNISQKPPSTAKAKSVVSGLSTKFAKKTAAKIAATKIGGKLTAALATNVVPVIGQVVSAVSIALSIKDLDVIIKKQIKEKSSKIPYIIGGLMIGGFALTGIPLFLAGGIGIIGLSSIGVTVATIATILGAIGTATISSFVVPALITFLGTPILVVFILFIINSGAYIYPPGNIFSPGTPGSGVGFTPTECTGPPPSPPNVANVIYSQDGRFAFPVAPGDSASYRCYHWDHEYAVDVFSPVTHPPLVAYTNGTVVNVTLDDPKGGKYVILKGDDGRYYYYAHNCHVYVQEGQRVRAGELLATMDATGNGRVQHLHFAINSSIYFPGGSGDVCPQQDFIRKFNKGCTNINMLCK